MNLLYHEATFDAAMKDRATKTFHSTATQAARIAAKAEVGQLVIGHVSARYENADALLEEAQLVFPNTVAASDGLILEVSR